MHKTQPAVILLMIIIGVPTATVYAQISVPKYEIGAGLSGYVYQGDLTPSRTGSYKTMRLGINLSAARIINRSFMVRLNVAIGGLRGDEAKYNSPEYRKERAFSFRTPLIELAPQLVWNPLGKNYAERGLSPYVFAGAGVSILKIKRDYSNYNAAYFGDGSDLPARIALDEAASLPRVIPVIPLGAGIRYTLSPSVSLIAESTYRLTFTDYLDGFSQAANPEGKDHYQTITVGGVYRFGGKNTLGCPVVKY
jgi:Domain of unknown function (DUF6089)